MVLALAAGCAGSGGGTHDLAGDDLSTSGPLACGALVDCLNSAGPSLAAQKACSARATERSSTLAQALFDCINGQCGPVDAGAQGSGPCASEPQCLYCVQFGTSPTGNKHGSCTNVDPATHKGAPTIDDPKCGLCVDQVNSCFSDDG